MPKFKPGDTGYTSTLCNRIVSVVVVERHKFHRTPPKYTVWWQGRRCGFIDECDLMTRDEAIIARLSGKTNA